MSHHLVIALYIFSAVSTGLLAGIYFIFSNTVMPALAGMATTSAAEVMQRINRLILNPPFLVLFMGSAFTSLLLIGLSLFGLGLPDSTLGIFAAGLTMTTFFSTIGGNVPLNNLLEGTSLHSISLDKTWLHYLSKWIKWNHLRALLSSIATILYSLELARLAF
ncbi:anthrone oxygenase family protein [Vibrio sp. VB16]|uniref:anthrone oxygenase family protein n=1 Tax=Vibrio sp. VB16 TaxID=2785746 RepID=UPI00189E504E|nr:anthrone oxygenase family protein [Vibrio sp. VB16]UGA57475.1 DUF1772 domain-containing protein [Vibrio sp. VB16]